MTVEDNIGKTEIVTNGAWGFGHIWETVLNQYGVPFTHSCISLIYAIYVRFTLVNVAIFLLKYVPTGIYMYKFMKNIYVTSRERIKQKQIELEDIQLQIQIVNTKLSVRDAQMTEREVQLRRGVEQLRSVRARVRGVIATDDTLRRALDGATYWDADPIVHGNTTPEEDQELIVELLKELKYEQAAIPERQTEKIECGENAQSEPNTPENSVYSSVSDGDVKQDCHVKIVRVTNVYKVAYLKHYIKQKRLRRATKQALLKKQMESIKKLLEDWQKTLNMVINTKLAILNMDPHVDVASQEAMGDYSKPNLRESSDSDSDLKNGGIEMCNDEYSLSWTQNPYRNYNYSYEDLPETVITRDFHDSNQEFVDTKIPVCDYTNLSRLSTLMEETKSQVAIDEIKSEAGEESVCQELDV
ncbi:uncharacterized protein ACR2FA_011388 [Aphomia sociella]